MSWALRSQDVTFTTFLADRLLHEYTTSGGFASSADLLDHLGTSMVLSDRLTFLAKYREFHRYARFIGVLYSEISISGLARYIYRVIHLLAMALYTCQRTLI